MFNQNFLSAILLVILFLLLGYFLRRKSIITDQVKTFLTFLVMNICIPALAFKSFVCDLDTTTLKTDFYIIILSFIIFIALLIVGNLLFFKVPKEKRKIYAIFSSIGQITLFSLPVIEAMFDSNEALITVNLVTIAFRFFLYIYGYIAISGCKLDQKSIKHNFINNPIIIMMLIGIFIWLSQGFMFQVAVGEENYSILRIDKTLPFLYQTITAISSITPIMSMLLIGSILGDYDIRVAIKDKLSFIIAFYRTFISSMIALVILLLANLLPFINLSSFQIEVITLAFASPISAVINTYAIKYNKESFRASNVCFISTIMCIATIPLIILILEAIF